MLFVGPNKISKKKIGCSFRMHVATAMANEIALIDGAVATGRPPIVKLSALALQLPFLRWGAERSLGELYAK